MIDMNLTSVCSVWMWSQHMVALRNWFFSTSSSKPAWPLTSLHSDPTDLQRMLSPLPSTWSLHTLKITTPISECCLLISAFNTISPMKLIGKLSTLGSFCEEVQDPFAECGTLAQTVRIGGHTSFTLVLNTGVPLGCALRPLLFTLYTQDCNLRHGENFVVKFANNTTIIGRISNNDKTSYRGEI